MQCVSGLMRGSLATLFTLRLGTFMIVGCFEKCPQYPGRILLSVCSSQTMMVFVQSFSLHFCLVMILSASSSKVLCVSKFSDLVSIVLLKFIHQAIPLPCELIVVAWL